MKAFSIHPKRLGVAFLVTAALVIGGCSGGGDDGGDDGGPGDGPSGGSGGGAGAPEVSFNLSGAVSLVANEDAIVQDSQSNSLSSDGRSLFTYSVARAPIINPARSMGRNDEDQGVSNLLAIDEQGNASLAIDTDQPLKAMYTVASPDGTKVYIALDTGWNDGGSASYDYAATIAAMNCGLLEVDVSNDDFRCVQEGLMVQNMDDTYFQNVSGNQKPIQFDADGNMYFAATSFTRQEDSFCISFDDNGNCTEEDTWYWLDFVEWNPLIYKMNASDQSVNNISQDNEHVSFFLTLSTGEVAYQAWQDNDSFGNLVLKVVNSAGSVVNLSSDAWVKFFTKDSENALVWGEEDWSSSSQGLKMAKPIKDDAQGRFQFASLDTSLFGAQDQSSGGWSSPTPRRIIMADDGRVYGVFESGSSEYDSTNDTWSWKSSLKVFQMLPFDGVPKVELDLGNDGWWTWMQDTPFQISRGFLYYTEEVNVPGLSTADVIRMVNLETRELTTLIDPNDLSATGRYEMYNWRLSGNTLFFSALELGSNTVVTGKIDTLSVRAGDAQSEFLTIQESASASGAASKVQDIEVIAPTAPPVEAGNFLVQDVHVDPVNIYSISVDFNKYPDADSINGNISVTSADVSEGDNGAIPTFKLWLYKTLHMVPDLEQPANSVDPLLLPDTVPLSFDETYTVAFDESSILDLSGFQLQTTSDVSLNTRPQTGWYNTSLLASGVDTDVATSKVLKYATSFDTWEKKGWDINAADVGANFQLDFGAKNFSWDGVDVMLFDKDNAEGRNGVLGNWDNDWASMIFNFRLSGWSNLEYSNSSSSQNSGAWNWHNHNWQDKDTHDTLFNGVWKLYRIKVYGTNIELSYSEDGTNYTTISEFSKTDLVSRSGTDYRLILRAASPLALDNVTITSSDASGNLGTVGDVYSEDFEGGGTPTEFSAPMNNTDSGKEWYPADIW